MSTKTIVRKKKIASYGKRPPLTKAYCITLPLKLMEEIDSRRGDFPRSTWLRLVVQEKLLGLQTVSSPEASQAAHAVNHLEVRPK